jgi:3-oxoacyl-[acyl-carrier protein] reductase
MDLGLSGKACIVTGASRGIGLATARMLCDEGASVLLLARSEEALREAAEQCGDRARALALDVTAVDAARAAAEACQDAFGGVDALVNNAGATRSRPMDDLTDAEWQQQWDLHVMAPMRFMRECAPRMEGRGGGRIVNVCSSSGKRPSLNNVAYSVTKAAQLSLSRAWADAWAGRGVLVNAVAPGPVETGMWLDEGGLADQRAEQLGTTREEVLRSNAERIPVGRFGTEQEIAAVITFLCSEHASNVAGAAWSVDGGAVPQIV